MRYRIPIQEKVTIWQNVDLIIDTEDSVDTIWDNMLKGKFKETYETIEIVNHDVMCDTEDHIEFDYGHTRKYEIEEL